jgi:uncharacterized alkaline shock family protein YloU
MSDVINSIFGRAQNETPSSEAYGYGTTETVDTDTTEVETAEPADEATEPEDAADAADEIVVADEAESDDEDEDTDTAIDTDEAVAEDPDSEVESGEAVATEEAPVAVATETEAAGSRPAAGSRGSTTIADGVIAKIVTMVARRAEGVHDLTGEQITVEVADEVATIKVPLVVEFGHAVKALAERIRVDVIEAVEQYLGLEVAAVDVHVADIHLPDAG